MRFTMGLGYCSFAVFTVLSVTACSRKSSESGATPAATAAASVQVPAAATAAAAAAATADAAAPIAPIDPVCKVESKKVWATGGNKLAGLTDTTLPDGRIAVGLAIGNTPEVLLVSANGKGSLVKVPLAAGSRLAAVPKGATRYLLRVTPVKVEGDAVKAFVDFEDHYKDKRRTVVCGPTDSNENWVEFDGTPFAARKDPKPEELASLFHQVGSEKVYDEVVTCRTFTNLEHADTWMLGSSLHATLAPDNKIAWRSDFIVTTAAKAPPKIIESAAVKSHNLDDAHFEVPVSHALRNGSYFVAARHRNHLVAGVLGADKTLVGNLAHYPGFPTLPDMADDGKESLVMVTALAKGKGDYGLRAIRVNEDKVELPKALHVVTTDLSTGDNPSESDPDFVRDVSGQRWIAHIEGERGNGRLALAPIDKDFHAVGRSFLVTEGGEKATAARVLAMKDKGLLVVFLRDAGKSLELVTEEVHCKVEK